MLFSKKPLIYLRLLDRSLRYLVINPKDHSISDVGEIVFETEILEDSKIINHSLLEARLDALVSEKKWKNAKVHMLVMSSLVTIREETVPAQLNEKEVGAYLDLHMNETIRMPFADPVFEFEIIEKNEENQKVVIIAYPGPFIKEYQELLEGVNLKPEVADLPSLSLYRVAEQQGLIEVAADVHTLILKWNPYTLNMAVFNLNRPKFNRESSQKHLIDSWSISPEGLWTWERSKAEKEAMIEEQLNGIDRFLNFYQHSVSNDTMPISEIILTGYYPDLDEVAKKLTERFSIPIKRLQVPGDLNQRFAALYGLSLKGGAAND